MKTLIVQSDLSQKITELELSLDALENEARKMRIAETLRLTDVIALKEQKVGQLQRLQDTPRLAAPAAGQITRLRTPTLGQVVPFMTEFLEIQPNDESMFKLTVELPLDVIETISEDTMFPVTMRGLDRRDRPALFAIWQPIEQTVGSSDGTVNLTLPLHPDSQRLLQDRSTRLGLSASNLMSEVTFTQSRKPLGRAMLDHLRSLR